MKKLKELLENNNKQSFSWAILHPDGKKEKIDKLKPFCDKHQINRPHLIQVANGKRHHSQGYQAKRIHPNEDINSVEFPKTESRATGNWLITHPDGKEEKIKSLHDFCVKNKLHHSHMISVANGDREHHFHYKVKRIPYFDEKE